MKTCTPLKQQQCGALSRWCSSLNILTISAGEIYNISEFEKYKENFEDKKVWGASKERVALYVLLELGLIRDHVEKRNLYNPVLPG